MRIERREIDSATYEIRKYDKDDKVVEITRMSYPDVVIRGKSKPNWSPDLHKSGGE